MPAHAPARQLNIESVDLEALDQFLRSDRAPADSMMLSALDGFLTGIAIGPGLVMPSEWLPVIWGGDPPAFADVAEAEAILGNIMARYAEILHEVRHDTIAPIFWIDRGGTTIASDWAEGFLQAIRLRAEAWEPLFTSKLELLLPIMALCRDNDGNALVPGIDDRMRGDVPELIPGCAMRIAAYWRHNGAKPISIPFKAGPRSAPNRAATKVGRNDPCPCGSGKKFKRCCQSA